MPVLRCEAFLGAFVATVGFKRLRAAAKQDRLFETPFVLQVYPTGNCCYPCNRACAGHTNEFPHGAVSLTHSDKHGFYTKTPQHKTQRAPKATVVARSPAWPPQTRGRLLLLRIAPSAHEEQFTQDANAVAATTVSSKKTHGCSCFLMP